MKNLNKAFSAAVVAVALCLAYTPSAHAAPISYFDNFNSLANGTVLPAPYTELGDDLFGGVLVTGGAGNQPGPVGDKWLAFQTGNAGSADQGLLVDLGQPLVAPNGGSVEWAFQIGTHTNGVNIFTGNVEVSFWDGAPTYNGHNLGFSGTQVDSTFSVAATYDEAYPGGSPGTDVNSLSGSIAASTTAGNLHALIFFDSLAGTIFTQGSINNLSVVQVTAPEPSTLMLFGIGVVGLIARRNRTKRS